MLAQTQHDFELLVWDDGSTDGSVEIAQHYAKQDKRVQVLAAEHQWRSPSLQADHATPRGLESKLAVQNTAIEPLGLI